MKFNMRATSLFGAIVAMTIGLAACLDESPSGTEAFTEAEVLTETEELTATEELTGAEALTADDPAPEIVQVPKELSMEQIDGGPTTAALTGCGRLVFCRDPRFTPRLPSFCTRARAGCNADKAFADAIQLCRSTCAPTSICSGAYYVLGRC
jgi:hypothetical protein